MKWTTEDSSEVVIAVNYVHYAVVKSVRKWLISKLIASACFPQINLLISNMAGHLACSSGYNTNHEPKTFCRLIRRCCLLRHLYGFLLTQPSPESLFGSQVKISSTLGVWGKIKFFSSFPPEIQVCVTPR